MAAPQGRLLLERSIRMTDLRVQVDALLSAGQALLLQGELDRAAGPAYSSPHPDGHHIYYSSQENHRDIYFFYDLFRVAGGKLVEHWDTIETVCD